MRSFPRRIHIVGVGGFGMSAIARVLLGQGHAVSGSDLRANDLTRALIESGLVFHEGHAPGNIEGAELLIVTSAASDANPEIAAARAAGIPVRRRQAILAELMAGQAGIAVAGTHGKTTTTALIVHLLREAGRDPSYIVGGVLQNTGSNAGVGQGAHFVIEADEYDRMFLGLRPQIAVIANVEHDHPDCYPTLSDVRAAFAAFAALLPDDGLLVVCADDAEARALGAAQHDQGRRVVFYGLGADAAWRASDLAADAAGGIRFTVTRDGAPLGRVWLNLLGAHNVQNALAALAVADAVGVPLAEAALGLESFLGTGRRGEMLGEASGITLISDYAHHPTAIRVTLAALRQRPGLRHLWAVWQPHTYGRLRALADDFARAFAEADHVLVTDVYSVREAVTPGLDAAGMAERIASEGHPDARCSGGLDATADLLASSVRPGDVVVLLSAGDLPRIGPRLLELLRAGDPREL